MKRLQEWCWLLVLCSLCPVALLAQTFTRITTGNPIVTDPAPGSSQYTGCAWADFDHDGDQDLYVVQQGLYRNDGSGQFTRVAGMPADHGNALGCSWADFDNDGDPDLYVSGGPPGGSYLNRNDGGGVFTRVTTGVIGNANFQQGWGCAWGDYDNDGRCDLIIAAAFGFNGIITPCHLLHNDGNGDFTSADTSIVVAIGNSSFTVPSWNDIDNDGDVDLFIASGPATGSPDRDFLYENRGTQPGQTFFRRVTTGALATDLHDGQLYNWVDIDGDGDLDCYVTNYGGLSGFQNTLYRNNAGVFAKLTAVVAGPIISDAQHSLASVWGDFDNDGDMDCYVTNEAGEFSMYYTNNGSGVFTNDAASTLHALGPHWGAAAADFDQDGDLDLYAHGSAASRGLYRNDSPVTNGWLDVRCEGSTSNRSAIGARVWMRATIGGTSRRLVQQVSAQNSFNGHSSFDLHFGAGDAAVVDSVIVRFPSGTTRVFTQVALRQTLVVPEDITTAVGSDGIPSPRDGLGIRWLSGNPVRDRMRFALTTTVAGDVQLAVVDASGRVCVRRTVPAGVASRQIIDLGSARGLHPGAYWVRGTQRGRVHSTRVVVLR
jgi:hypothetical protein